MSKVIEQINNKISKSKSNGFDISNISDGYHTFSELYKHRHKLFIALALMNKEHAWKFKKNDDGEEWKGLFGLGIFKQEGKQISYHLPIEYWDDIDCEEFDINPYYDGHSSEDVLLRLKSNFI